MKKDERRWIEAFPLVCGFKPRRFLPRQTDCHKSIARAKPRPAGAH